MLLVMQSSGIAESVQPTILTEKVTFARQRSRLEDLPNFAASEVPVFFPPENPTVFGSDFAECGVLIDRRLIEQFERGEAHVDFANRQLHIGTIIPSCTQEEIMFTVRPELYASLVVFDTLDDDEAAVISNALTLTTYSGYLSTFTVTGIHPDPSGHRCAVIAIDAHINQGGQFDRDMVRRDMAKALTGFRLCREARAIATGPWGCGVFRGDKTLKFVQQAVAAALCEPRKYLYYHAADADVARLQALARGMAALRLTCGWVYANLDEYRTVIRSRLPSPDPPTYVDFLERSLYTMQSEVEP